MIEVEEIVRRAIRASDEELNLNPDPDFYTNYYLEDHHESVPEVAVEAAMTFGVNDESIEVIRTAGSLHDNSKTNPDFHKLWRRNRVLTHKEREAMREHAFEAAANLLVMMDWVSDEDAELLWKAYPVVWRHHEWWMLDDPVMRQQCMFVCCADRLVSKMEDRGSYHRGSPQDVALEWLLDINHTDMPASFRQRHARERAAVMEVFRFLYERDETGQYRRTINLRRNKGL